MSDKDERIKMLERRLELLMSAHGIPEWMECQRKGCTVFADGNALVCDSCGRCEDHCTCPVDCESCDGTGEIEQDVGDGVMVYPKCPHCGGRGFNRRGVHAG